MKTLITPISTRNTKIFNKRLIIADSAESPVILHFDNEKEIENLIGLLFQLKSEL